MGRINSIQPSKAVKKYLANYAENESQQLDLLNQDYDYVIVIPVCNESLICLETIFSKIDEAVLIIAVVNSPLDKKEWQLNNELFINSLSKSSNESSVLSTVSRLLKFDKLNDVLLVDKNSQGNQINADYGVGLARKIGCDIALKCYVQGYITNPWIYSTDADVILSSNYFSQSVKCAGKNSAVILDFEHVSDDSRLNDQQFYYDFKLRYYRSGIAFAGSTYDYIPLGSTMIVNMDCYAQVRGFPKRNAGEDFYLLNKLAKIKPIKYLVNDVVIKIQARYSDRVPFGTGPALIQINNLPTIGDYKYYNPICFKYLKQWIEFLRSRWVEDCLVIEKPCDNVLSELYDFFGCEVLFLKTEKQIKSSDRWQQFILQWFDAFKVLKTVHFLDKKYKRLNYLELLKTENFDKVIDSKLIEFIRLNDKI